MVLGNPLIMGKDPPLYSGSYTISPTAAEQVIPTQGKLMSSDLVIGSCPSGDGMGSYMKARVEGEFDELIDEQGILTCGIRDWSICL